MALRSAVLLAIVAVVRTQVRPPSHFLADRELHRIAPRQTHLKSAKVIPFSRDPRTVSVQPRSLLRLETFTSPAPQPNVYGVSQQPSLGCPRDEDPIRGAGTPTDDRLYHDHAPVYPPWMWSSYFYPNWSGLMPVYVPAMPHNPRSIPRPEGKVTGKSTADSEPKPGNPKSPNDAKSAIENRRAMRRKQREDAVKVIDYLIDWGTNRKRFPELNLDEDDSVSYVTSTDRLKLPNVYPLPRISVGGKPQPSTVYDKRRIFTDPKKPTR